MTPFQLAMREESWNVAELLITRGCTLGGFDDEQLLGFLRHHSGDLASPKDVIKGLNERLRNSVNGHNIVSKLVDRNDIQTLQLLLEAGFSPNEAEQKTSKMEMLKYLTISNYCVSIQILCHYIGQFYSSIYIA